MIQKQIVYLPIKEHSVFKILESGATLQNCYPEEGYFFTPEQLNEYTANIIRQALEVAAEKVEHVWDGNENELFDIDKQSIIDTFEETFKLFEV